MVSESGKIGGMRVGWEASSVLKSGLMMSQTFLSIAVWRIQLRNEIHLIGRSRKVSSEDGRVVDIVSVVVVEVRLQIP